MLAIVAHCLAWRSARNTGRTGGSAQDQHHSCLTWPETPVAKKEEWRTIVASSLDWEQAHASLESALKGLAPELRGKRPTGFPHSAWDLLEHIRITQRDLLEFVQNPSYEEKLEWPKDYWPTTSAPGSEKAWNECIAGWR